MIGHVIDGAWRIERLLGSGGVANVYAARSPSGQSVAIKLLHPIFRRQKSIVERFLREAYVLHTVQHPGIVRVLHASAGRNAYIVMELLDGESLDKRLERGPLSLGEALWVAAQVLELLAIAHDRGVVHRDIKPANVFLTRDGTIKLLDFGIARLRDTPAANRSATGLAIGTIDYMAPEQALGRQDQIDRRTDIFGVGAMLFELITGRTPHAANTPTGLLFAVATQRAPLLATVARGIPEPIAEIVDRALEYEPERRHSDARSMQRAIYEVLYPKPTRPRFGSKLLSDHRLVTAFLIAWIGLTTSFATLALAFLARS